MTNSIPLSGGASDVSGFARSFRRRSSIRQGGADDVVRYTEVLHRPTTIRLRLSRLPLALPLSLSLLRSLRQPLCTPPPSSQASLRLTGVAAERSVPFLAPILYRFRLSALPLPAICHSIPFRSFHLTPIVPSPFPLSLSMPHSLYSRYTFAPSMLTPMRYA